MYQLLGKVRQRGCKKQGEVLIWQDGGWAGRCFFYWSWD